MLAADAGIGECVLTSYGGPWTLEKLDVIEAYLDAYTTVLKNQRFQLIYVDAFAGDGTWQLGSGYAPEDYEDFTAILKGSAARALGVQNRSFDRLVFIEKDQERSETLRTLGELHSDRNIEVITDDANAALPEFCRSMGRFDRAVVFLDPFATEVNWATVEAIAQTERIDCWILFPLMAITRMMPTESVPPDSLATHLDRIFGGNEHWQNFYQESLQLSFFTDAPRHERPSGSALIAARYRERLESVFARVAPTSRTFKN